MGDVSGLHPGTSSLSTTAFLALLGIRNLLSTDWVLGWAFGSLCFILSPSSPD